MGASDLSTISDVKDAGDFADLDDIFGVDPDSTDYEDSDSEDEIHSVKSNRPESELGDDMPWLSEAQGGYSEDQQQQVVIPHTQIFAKVTSEVMKFVGKVNTDVSLFNVGLKSNTAAELQDALSNVFDQKLGPLFLWEHETVAKICDYFQPPAEVTAESQQMQLMQQAIRLFGMRVKVMVAVEGFVGKVDSDTNLFEAGLTSKNAANLRDELSKNFHVQLSPSFIYECDTVDRIVTFLRNPRMDHDMVDTVREAMRRKIFIHKKVTEEVERYVGKVDPDTSLMAAGLTSKTAVDLRDDLAECFKVKLGPDFVYQCNTLGMMCDYFRAELAGFRVA